MVENKQRYLYISKSTFDAREMNPWMALCFSIFGGGSFHTRAGVISHLPTVMTELMQTLTPREACALVHKYGVEYQTRGNDNETLSQDQESAILNKAIRKMRHPSRVKKLLIWYAPNFSSLYSGQYYEQIQSIFMRELRGVLEKGQEPNVYLSPIFERNQISLKCTKLEANRSYSLEQDLSVRSLNALKRVGINTLEDLTSKISEDDSFLLQIPNLGVKAREEIKKIIHKYLSPDAFSTVEVLRAGEKTIYKFDSDDMDNITESIFINEMQRNNPATTILNGPFSPGLTNILLMMGYFYQDDVFQNTDSLCEKLQTVGLAIFAKELMTLKEYHQATTGDELEDVYVFPPSLAELAQKSNSTTPEDFIVALKNNGYSDEAERLSELLPAREAL